MTTATPTVSLLLEMSPWCIAVLRLGWDLLSL